MKAVGKLLYNEKLLRLTKNKGAYIPKLKV